ncbi:MAG TPA: hypothetical protein VGN55_07600 [Xanthobacteraceae bacterium]|jgi:hypothetical protein
MAEELPEIKDEWKRRFDWAVRHFINGWRPEEPDIAHDGYSVGQVFEHVTRFSSELKNDPVADHIFLYLSSLSRYRELQEELGRDETYPTAARCMLKAMDWRMQKPTTKP